MLISRKIALLTTKIGEKNMLYLLTSKSAQLLKTILVYTCCLVGFNVNLEAQAVSVSAFTYNPTNPPSGAPATGTVFTLSTTGNGLGVCQLTPPSGGATSTGSQTYSIGFCLPGFDAGGTDNTAVAYLASPNNTNNYFAMGADSGNVYLCNINYAQVGGIYQANDVSCGSSVEKFGSAVGDLAFDQSSSSLWATTIDGSVLNCPFTTDGNLESCSTLVEGGKDNLIDQIIRNQIIVNPSITNDQGDYQTIVVVPSSYEYVGTSSAFYSCYASSGCSNLNSVFDNNTYAVNSIAYDSTTDTLYSNEFLAGGNILSVQGVNSSNPTTNTIKLNQNVNSLAFSPYPTNIGAITPYTNGLLLIGTQNSSYVYAYDPVAGGEISQIFTNNGDNGEFNGNIYSFLFDPNGNVLIQYGGQGLSIANPFVVSGSADNINSLISEDADSGGSGLGTADKIAELAYYGVSTIKALAPVAAAFSTNRGPQPQINTPVSTPEPSAVAGLSLLVGLGLLSRRRS